MTSTPNTGYLIEDQWDDWFQYSTMYDLYIVDSLSHQCYMGKTKIGQKGMVEDQRRPALPESFSRLSEDFFSLGQDSYYYENIKNLGDVMRSEILAALNDIAYNTKLIRTAQKEPVTKKSLLRSVPLTTVKEQFNRIALGGARLTPYNFEYRSVPIREGIEPITIEFNVDPDSYPPSNIHVIIGRNGVGKTYLISNMIRSIIQPRNNLRENVGETRFLHDKQTAVDHFSRIVFVSFSAFDELNFKTKSEKFVRIGLPAHSGENTHEHLNKIFAASFSACLHGPQRMLLTKVLHILYGKLINTTENILPGIFKVDQRYHSRQAALGRELNAVHHPAIDLVQSCKIAFCTDKANGIHNAMDLVWQQIRVGVGQETFQIVGIQHIHSALPVDFVSLQILPSLSFQEGNKGIFIFRFAKMSVVFL